MGKEYCGYCTIMWNRRENGASKMNHINHTKDCSSYKEGDVAYTIGLEGNSFQKTKWLIPKCSHLDQLKTPLNKKHPELVNVKCIIFHQDNGRLHVSLMTRQKLLQFEKFWFILHIRQTLHLQMSIYFGLYKIFLTEKILILWKTVKGTWNNSLLKNIKNFGKMELWKLPGKWQKVVKQNGEYIVQ